jgi:hypothetical protein
VLFDAPEAAAACMAAAAAHTSSVEAEAEATAAAAPAAPLQLALGGRALSFLPCRADLVAKWLAPAPLPKPVVVTTATVKSFVPRGVQRARPAAAPAPAPRAHAPVMGVSASEAVIMS